MILINPDLSIFEPEWIDYNNIELHFDNEENPSAIVNVKIELCDNCEGKGKHLQTSLRSIAFSRDDEDYDPEFMEEMMEGYFDQLCDRCNGQGRIYDIDWNSCPQFARDEIKSYSQAAYENRMEYESEMRYMYGSNY